MSDPGDYHGYRAGTGAWADKDLEDLVGTQALKFFTSSKTITFAGSAGNGAVGTIPLFGVTGRVLIHHVVAYCSTDLVSSGGTLEFGIASNASLLGQDAASGFLQGKIWTMSLGGFVTLTDGAVYQDPMMVLEDDDIILTVIDAAITAGQIDFEILWSPILGGGSISAA